MNKYLLSAALLALTNTTLAATPVDLRKHPEMLGLNQSYVANGISLSNVNVEQISKDDDINHTTHIRIQQTYNGIPVLGAVAILHQKPANNKALLANNKPSADGVVYNGLQQDLSSAKAPTLDSTLTQKALSIAKAKFVKSHPNKYSSYKDESVKLVIYTDKNNQAHYGLLTTFYVDDHKTGAHRPMIVINADTMQIAGQWDVVKHEDSSKENMITPVAGIGGNEKTGEIIYDGLSGHLQPVAMTRIPTIADNDLGGECYLANKDAVVQDVAYENDIPSLSCDKYQGQHNDLPFLWDGETDENGNDRWPEDQINGSYSPSLDALYAANTIINLYKDWYGIPALTQDDHKTPMQLIMRVHYGRNYDNAFWDGKVMTFGDGNDEMYPLTSLDVAAHEVSHGFTQQNSNIDAVINDLEDDSDLPDNVKQLMALDESFSDMASAAATYYTTGKNDWMLGSSVMKNESAQRYMDDPKKDGMSINNYNDPHPDESHLLAGVFNRAFYLIATSPNWDTHKAFDIMVEANRHYWTPGMKTMIDAACGVMSATKGLKYNEADVMAAFAGVGIDVSKC